MKKNKILITCGPTWVAIDEVRVISNHSSGEMGHGIAEQFVKQGASVTLLEGPVSHAWAHKSVKVIKYRFFDELERYLKVELKKNYDCVIHAAAVSDFKLAQAAKGKISSDKALTLKLVPASKIIESIKKIAPQTVLVGFKLEPGLTSSNVSRETKGLFEKANCDWVVANSVNRGYQGFILDRQGKVVAKGNTKNKIAELLVGILL